MHASTSQEPFDPRPSYLDATALSAAEFTVYPQWLALLKPARSGEPDRFEEQDALRFLRENCGIGVHDEIKILSLFERFPLGILPEHFYAMLRLASWVQRGETPSKSLLFTQTPPPRVGLSADDFVQPPPQHASASGPLSVSPRTQRSAMLAAAAKSGRSVPPLPAPGLYAPAPTSANIYVTHKPALPPPVPDDSHKPNNPFRIASATSSNAAMMQQSPIVGFDPAPNPFKQSKPRLIKPTPIVADASTPMAIKGNVGGMTNLDPFKSGQSSSSRANSPELTRSVMNASPPPIAGELKPPPLPPRHISPLIQASLNARSQVRKAKEALPPKTFTVLQSTQSRHPLEKPRLLTGQAAPPPPPPPAQKRRSITETRISSSSITGGGVAGGTGTTSSSKAATEHVPERRAGPLPAPIAPKASYGTNRKTSVPAWLQEQEELQRSSSLEHHNAAPPPRDHSHSRTTSHSKGRKKRTTSEAARIQFLDNESDSSSDDADGTLSEQARSAASIDRNNPFFQHGRDHERSMNLKESLSKLAVENAVAKAEHDSRMSRANSDGSTTKGDADRRALNRSRTLRAGMPPAVPPRKRTEAFPATFNSGTYPGFGRPVRVEGPTIGGLRQIPTSRKAEVGIPAHVLAERERMEREKYERASTAPPRDSDSGLDNILPPPPRRSNSNSQISVSDGETPLSPHDDEDTLSPFSNMYVGAQNVGEAGNGNMGGTIKQELETFTDRHSWLGRLADRVTGRKNEAQIGLMEDIANQQQNGNDEPEVDEHYLAEKRREQLKERQWQRGNSIDVIREEDTTPVQHSNTGRRSSSGPIHPSLSQRRATDSARRSPSTGAGSMAGIVRRSSMLARGSFGAEDVVADDDDDDDDDKYGSAKEDDQMTPRFEKGAILSPAALEKVNGRGRKAPDVDAVGEQDRRQEGWQPLR